MHRSNVKAGRIVSHKTFVARRPPFFQVEIPSMPWPICTGLTLCG